MKVLKFNNIINIDNDFFTIKNMESKHVVSILLLITFLVYAPGLMGGFLLDDNVNLITLNVFSKFEGLEAFIRYITSNESGILKRPISTLSFLLNSQSWPAMPYYFKMTNILIHLLNGVLLYLVIKKILLALKFKSDNIDKIAVFSMALWLLNPYLVSTVLYVIQRMAMLPVTFVLIGMNLYLKGRALVLENITKGKYYIFISIIIFTPLAILAKENGIILPFLILALEYILESNQGSCKVLKKFKRYLLVVPSILIIVALVFKLPTFLDQYLNRDFSISERLLTESRVLVTSLAHLFIPEIITEGVYTDGYEVSKSLTSPITTLYSIILIIFLISLSFLFKKKKPLLSFSILFFFIAHLIESSVVPLEIYFEHRNYLPSLFTFLYVSYFIINLQKKSIVFVFLPYIIVGYMSYITYHKTSIWRNNVEMTKLTMEKYPHSYRATERRVADLFISGDYKGTLALLAKAVNSFDSISFRLKLYNLNCNTKDRKEFEDVLEYIDKTKVRTKDKTALVAFLNGLLNNVCGKDSLKIADELIKAIKVKKGASKFRIRQTILFFESMLELEKKRPESSKKLLFKYMDQHVGYTDMIIGIKHFISKGYKKEANELIRYMRIILKNRNVLYSSNDYMLELDKLEIMISLDLTKL